MRRDLTKQLEALWSQLGDEYVYAGGVATRPVDAVDETKLDWITTG